MNGITEANRGKLRQLISYLEQGSAGRLLDDEAAEVLSKIFTGVAGFNWEKLRESPVSTLLKLLADPAVVNTAEVLLGPAVEGSPLFSLLGASLSNVGVLAGTAITSSGATVVTGDMAVSPGTTISGFPPGICNGAPGMAPAASAQKQLALTDAYLDMAGRPATATVAGDIGGRVFLPGVYHCAGALSITSGDIILDGGGDVDEAWIFQAVTSFDLAAGRRIILTNGAHASRVFWQTNHSATLGIGSSLKGFLVAHDAITLNTSAVVEGAILAISGSVTLDTNIIIRPT